MPESDLDLLIRAATQSGDIARRYWKADPKVWDKGDGAGPVTEADLAVNDMLHSVLRQARPDFGWLSEESEDGTDRLSCDAVFIVDPIDGTRAFVAGERTWSHSLAIVRQGAVAAGVVYVPMLDTLYAAASGTGAFRNGDRIAVGADPAPDPVRVLAARTNLDARNWPSGQPPMTRVFRPSLAYRLSLVADGQFDAMLTLRDSWEWDIAAGALIVAEAGGIATDRHGAALRFNTPHPVTPGVLAAGARVHARLLAGLSA